MIPEDGHAERAAVESGSFDLRAALADAAALRVTVAAAGRLDGDEPVVIGRGVRADGRKGPAGQDGRPTVDGIEQSVRLERRDDARAVLVEGEGLHAWRTRVVFGRARRGPDGRERREVVVDGWRFELEVEQEQRARLRERATGGGGAAPGHGARAEIRAMIPGKVVAVDVAPGDHVDAGQRLLVLEAMKMQNEVRADRAGTVERVEAAAGQTVELGDVLVVVT